MNQSDFLPALESSLHLRGVAFSRAALEAFVEDAWVPITNNPDVEFWTREFVAEFVAEADVMTRAELSRIDNSRPSVPTSWAGSIGMALGIVGLACCGLMLLVFVDILLTGVQHGPGGNEMSVGIFLGMVVPCALVPAALLCSCGVFASLEAMGTGEPSSWASRIGLFLFIAAPVTVVVLWCVASQRLTSY